MGRQEAIKAIKMQAPEYVPVFFFNRDKELSDILMCGIQDHFGGEDGLHSEWGFEWEQLDDTMGQPRQAADGSPAGLWGIRAPEANRPGRFDEAEKAAAGAGAGKYIIAGLELSGFTTMTCLAGFGNVLEGLCADPGGVGKLADTVFGFEEELIGLAAGRGFDAIGFFDDWGTQQSLIISPEMWRQAFKPRYKKQFDLAHGGGMDVFFHSCGNIIDIIGDLVEIGADVLNISQPNLFDIEKLGREFGGKVCFMCPVSYQTTSISGTKEEIYSDVKTLVDNLGRYNGGLIGYVEEYSSIGMPDENYWHCVNAFRELGRYGKTRLAG